MKDERKPITEEDKIEAQKMIDEAIRKDRELAEQVNKEKLLEDANDIEVEELKSQYDEEDSEEDLEAYNALTGEELFDARRPDHE